jgi:hypothetical protein
MYNWSSYLLCGLYVESVGHVTTLTHLVVISDYTATNYLQQNDLTQQTHLLNQNQSEFENLYFIDR